MTKKPKSTFAKKLKLAMTESGLNQVSLAKKLGLTSSSISLWSSGKGNPSFDTLNALAEALEKPLNYFFDNSPVGDGNQIINGSHNQTCNNKDYALILAKIATLESKVENLELKYDLLKKQK